MRVELVHLTLDLVFEGFSPNATVVDAARGSGPSHRGFLATGLARYQWQVRPPGTRRSVLPALGVHINCGALGIAVFCLWLAALKLDEQPIDDTRDLKFDPVNSITPYWQIQSGRICPLRSQADLSTPWSGILHGLREQGMQRRKPKRFRYIDAPSETEPRLGIPATLSSRPPWPRCRSVRTGRLHRPGT